MTTKLRMPETIENAFIAGLLLTGSVEPAEKAILESVKMACPDERYRKGFIWCPAGAVLVQINRPAACYRHQNPPAQSKAKGR